VGHQTLELLVKTPLLPFAYLGDGGAEIVVTAALGDTIEIPERPDMTVHETLQLLAGIGADKRRTTVSQTEAKQMDRHRLLAEDDMRLAPVHLRFLAGLEQESEIDLLGIETPGTPPEIAPHGINAARVAVLLVETLVDHEGIGSLLARHLAGRLVLHPSVNDAVERIKRRRCRLGAPVGRLGRGVGENFADRVAAVAVKTGNFPL
jgi:hypothetical protein